MYYLDLLFHIDALPFGQMSLGQMPSRSFSSAPFLSLQDQAELELREALAPDVPRERGVQGPEVRHPHRGLHAEEGAARRHPPDRRHR